MSEEKIAISSLAMDLKRVALGFYNGSENTADRFCQEAEKRISEIKPSTVPPYIKSSLKKVKTLLQKKEGIAEDALMYSTIFQNYAVSTLP